MKLTDEAKDFIKGAITMILVFLTCLLIASTMFNR
jgi:hypothetical protein